MKKQVSHSEPKNTPLATGQEWQDTKFRQGTRTLVINGMDGRTASCLITETTVLANKEQVRSYGERLPISSICEQQGHVLIRNG